MPNFIPNHAIDRERMIEFLIMEWKNNHFLSSAKHPGKQSLYVWSLD
jgi:hypothetical protein